MKPSLIPHDISDVQIHHGDFLDLTTLENPVDLTVTSPPYNLDIQYDGHDDGLPYDEYLKWNFQWLYNCYNLTAVGGRICLNIPLDKNIGGKRPIYHDLLYQAQKAGWKYFTTIVWLENNISRRTAWGSFMKATAPHVIAPVEMILVLHKGDQWKRDGAGRVSDIGRQEFIDWTNGCWQFNGETKKRAGHPAPFPPELPKRCIKLFSFVGDTVLDPFCGSGTTLMEARRLGRKAVGCDTSNSYCARAIERVNSAL